MRSVYSRIRGAKRHLDTTIVVPNQNLFKIANETTDLKNFSLSNDVLKHGVQSITDLVRPGMINLDFVDVGLLWVQVVKFEEQEAEETLWAMAATELALIH